jgi:hypothetical protein
MTLRVTAVILIVAAMPYVAAAAVAISMPVPADVQAGLFRSIWKLDRNFDCTKGVRLGIVYQENYFDSLAAKDDFLAVIDRLGPHTIPVLIPVQTDQSLTDVLQRADLDMLYVTPLRAVDVAVIGQISRARRFRTFTGVPEYVEHGIAVGIGIRRDRPMIIVNLEQARAEGAAFSSQLLALARIVGAVQQ